MMTMDSKLDGGLVHLSVETSVSNVEGVSLQTEVGKVQEKKSWQGVNQTLQFRVISSRKVLQIVTLS